METDRKKITEENLIRCGREEFLEKGYAGANLRDICKRAGVTTGAFYFSFENKEALLGAILDPLIAEYQKMMQQIAKESRNILRPQSRMNARSWNISVRTGRNVSWYWRNAPAANTNPSGM
ncbi:MAG: TetR/AcrR family transcriptional regulator [Waltera sp.]